MFKSIAATLVLTAAMAAPTMAHADSLVGSTLGASLTGTPGLSVTNQFAPSAIVGPGTEFTGSLFDAFHQSYDVNLDVYASGFLLNVTSPFNKANVSSNPLYQLTLSGLPSFVNGFSLSSYNCDLNKNPNCSPHPLSFIVASNTFSGSTLTLDLSYLANGQSFNFAFTEAPPSSTPEPSSLALFGTGLVGIAGMLRRRVTAKFDVRGL